MRGQGMKTVLVGMAAALALAAAPAQAQERATAEVHGDTPGAVDIARVLCEALKDNEIAVAPFKTPK